MNFLTSEKEDRGFMNALKAGLDTGKFNSTEFERIKSQLGRLLHTHVLNYSGSQSNSLQEERVNQLTGSFLYTLDLYLDTFLEEDIADVLKSQSLDHLYRDAYAYIQIYKQETEVLFQSLKRNRVPIENDVYTDTFERALPDFFKRYNYKYDAEDLVSDIDYPLLFDKMDLKGIRYIRNYIELFQVENEVVKYFPDKARNQLLKGYALKSGLRLKDLPTNLCEPVIQSHFFMSAVSSDPSKLVFSQDDFIELRALVNSGTRSTEGLLKSLMKAYTASIIYWPDSVRAFAEKFADLKRPYWKAAIDSGNLENLIVV